MSDATEPMWGYRPDGEAKIFDLAPGETLPDGWSPSPAVITDPTLATSEALSAAALGQLYIPHVIVDDAAAAVDPDALSRAVAEIDRLNGIITAGSTENAALIAEIEAAEAAVETATTELTSLRELLDAETIQKADALSKVEALTSDLTKATADLAEAHTALEQATAPAPADAPKAPAKAK